MRTKSSLFLALTLIALAGVSGGCFGKFALTRKLYGWNDSLGNKFVKTIAFWALTIIPAYELMGLGDFLVLNVIEFWTGSNPVAGVRTETLPDGSVRIEQAGVVLLLVPTGEGRFDIVREGERVGTATLTADRGLLIQPAGSGQLVRLSAADVARTEAMTAQCESASADIR